ncbi:MAG TPA: 5'/3'-nucleotidase SurE [Candidatus Aminicenantes bacterium]|nr:5'/3'-nucleotidase SurE [Candidatus Aminicenantes bacterium]
MHIARGSQSGPCFFVALVFIVISLSPIPSPAQQPYRILISNDDGFQAPGIKALFSRLKSLGEVTVAAPAGNQSGVGHALTFGRPMAVESWEAEGTRWFAIAATPATCVRMALTSLLLQLPDVVVSGINKGENAGVGTFSSGTVACAREAAYRDIPAIAVSQEEGAQMDYAAAAEFTARLLLEVRKRGLPRGSYLNVNFPARPSDQIKGVLVTRQDMRPADEHYARKTSPEGKTEYWSVYRPLTGGDKNTDTWALTQGYVSITPMWIDQTFSSLNETILKWDIVKSKK